MSPKIMTGHFSGLIFIELALNHEIIEEHCISIDNLASITYPRHLYSVLSSVKLQRSSSSIHSNKSSRGLQGQQISKPVNLLCYI